MARAGRPGYVGADDRWNIKPIAGTDSCQVSHLGYCVSGRIRVRMDDGTVGEVGDEACVFIDFGEFGDYAKRA